MAETPSDTALSLRDAILGAARDLLLESGYAGISMRKVAERIGYSATSIYLYFRNKDALFHALIDGGMSRLNETILTARAGAADPLARLRAMCGAYVRFGLDNPAYYEVMFNLHPRHMARYPMDRYRAARRNLDLFADALDEAAAARQIAPCNAPMMAGIVWAALHGSVTLVLAQRLDARLDPDTFLHDALDHTLRGLLAPDAAR